MIQRTARNKPVWIGAGVIGLILLFCLWAPSQSWQNSGSTYNRAPDGYGAWYAYMQQQGATIDRMREPLDQFRDRTATPTTLLQIRPQLTSTSLDEAAERWVQAGNRLIVLGVRQPVTEAEFSSLVHSPSGLVKIETRRRAQPQSAPKAATPLKPALLKDDNGPIVWPSPDHDRLIWSVTPYIAANAYQNQAGNFAFLADLVSQAQQPIVVDEYIHGYRPPRPPASRTARRWSGGWGRQSGDRSSRDRPDILGYLLGTPLLVVIVQALVLMGLVVWSQNQRFGALRSVLPVPLDNSMAYIQALAGALRKANSGQFVVETVTQAELKQLQRQLGLGHQPIALADLKQAWLTQNHPATPAQIAAWQQLEIAQTRKFWRDQDLTAWLQALDQIQHHPHPPSP
jgi:Domain of unknown function (DUF4350)